MLKKFIILSLFLFLFFIYAYSQTNFAVSLKFTPVLNTSDYRSVFGGKSGTKVKLDHRGLIGEMEFIAFPNTVFEILEEIPYLNFSMYKVNTNDYPYNSVLYIDSRFVKVTDTMPKDREQIFPDKNKIIENLNSLEGVMYMWGGNTPNGIPELLEYYPPDGNISETTKDLWILKGVDCSGLLYFATDGCTPRNTSSLTTYGDAVEISGLNSNQISKKVLPLDLIVWNGHVIMVLDNDNVIESTPSKGVHKTNLLSRLKSIMSERKPVNDWESTSGKRFVVRRWNY